MAFTIGTNMGECSARFKIIPALAQASLFITTPIRTSEALPFLPEMEFLDTPPHKLIPLNTPHQKLRQHTKPQNQFNKAGGMLLAPGIWQPMGCCFTWLRVKQPEPINKAAETDNFTDSPLQAGMLRPPSPTHPPYPPYPLRMFAPIGEHLQGIAHRHLTISQPIQDIEAVTEWGMQVMLAAPITKHQAMDIAPPHRAPLTFKCQPGSRST